MVYRGHVHNGVIRLDEPTALPEGIEVEVRLLTPATPQNAEEEFPNACAALKDFAGKAEGLPPDASINHDHYLYGLPKRQ